MWKFSFPRVIISNNGTQFSNSTVVNFSRGLGVQTKFISEVYPNAKEHDESENKGIFRGMKKLDESKEL